MHAEFEVGVSFADAVGLAVCERRTDPKATIRINAKSRTGKADRRRKRHARRRVARGSAVYFVDNPNELLRCIASADAANQG